VEEEETYLAGKSFVLLAQLAAVRILGANTRAHEHVSGFLRDADHGIGWEVDAV